MRTKRQRLADFAERARTDEEVFARPGLGRCVTVHPMADEAALLARLGIEPAACVKVDLYWEHAGDVAFVQIETMQCCPLRPPGLYVRRSAAGHVNLVAIVPDDVVRSTTVERVLRRFAAAKIVRSRLGDALVPLLSPAGE
ncbi:hypothetical protein SAMN02745121_06069 [Nannocystis exedens]|uniref:Uncharacterized protein n=1 Tax=Nannocystis exedens TaxID=54 RepID=A0A1I2EFS6_9BACT|nr:hypothetical protein [Nannocystis exedens]PCC74751.1 hypothetical protein NAEX_07850 [Nannocystis exedens]SFE91497.1 hypothetical protein SAMN02745121_06069 [Nannocystis exedens]